MMLAHDVYYGGAPALVSCAVFKTVESAPRGLVGSIPMRFRHNFQDS